MYSLMEDDISAVSTYLRHINPTAIDLYEWLLVHRTETNSMVRCGREKIRKAIGCSPNKLTAAVQLLRFLRLIEIKETPKAGKQHFQVIPYFRSTLYRFVQAKEKNYRAVVEFIADQFKAYAATLAKDKYTIELNPKNRTRNRFKNPEQTVVSEMGALEQEYGSSGAASTNEAAEGDTTEQGENDLGQLQNQPDRNLNPICALNGPLKASKESFEGDNSKSEVLLEKEEIHTDCTGIPKEYPNSKPKLDAYNEELQLCNRINGFQLPQKQRVAEISQEWRGWSVHRAVIYIWESFYYAVEGNPNVYNVLPTKAVADGSLRSFKLGYKQSKWGNFVMTDIDHRDRPLYTYSKIKHWVTCNWDDWGDRWVRFLLQILPDNQLLQGKLAPHPRKKTSTGKPYAFVSLLWLFGSNWGGDWIIDRALAGEFARYDSSYVKPLNRFAEPEEVESGDRDVWEDEGMFAFRNPDYHDIDELTYLGPPAADSFKWETIEQS